MRFRKSEWPHCFAASLLLVSACRDETGLDRYSFAEVSVHGSVKAADGGNVAGARVAVVGIEKTSASELCEVTAPGAGFTIVVQTASSGNFAARLQTSPTGSRPICLTLHVSPPTDSGLADTVLFGIKATTGTAGTKFVPDTIIVPVVLHSK